MGGILLQCMTFGEIVKSVLKSWFFTISPDFNDFTRFQPDFTNFWFFQTIQHVKHVLTHKIVRFYQSKHDFNNLGSIAVWSHRPWATTPPLASIASPPAKQPDQQHAASSAPGNSSSPFIVCVLQLFTSCMQNE
jgi:hypothetical protein